MTTTRPSGYHSGHAIRGVESPLTGLRRCHVVEAAVEVFGEHGYDAANRSGMHAIAHRAGASTTELYRMFGDRMGLYRAAVLFAAQQFVDVVARASEVAALWDTPRDRTRAFLFELLKGIRRHPAVWSTLTERPRNASAAGELVEAQVKLRTAIIGSVLTSDHGPRTHSGDEQPELAALFVYGGLAEVLRHHLNEASGADDTALVAFLVDMTAGQPPRRGSHAPRT